MTATRSILVTGASSGIGYAAARILKERGWRVLATARRQESLDELRNAVGVEAIHLELADTNSIDACARAALELTDGRIDALFNNAAFGQVGAVEDLEFLLASELEALVGAPPVVLRRFQKMVESLRPRPLPAPTGPSSVPPSSPCSACSFFLVLSSNA